ncbi:MAG: RHH-type proline utilization regulon transcriptional repressor/proline dehydrogenase, partial [Myxococcota bacterium]
MSDLRSTNELDRLEAIHRLEALLEGFRLTAEVTDDTLSFTLANASTPPPVVDLNEPVQQLEDRLIHYLTAELEAAPHRFLEMPRRGALAPKTNDFPESTAWLERFYGLTFLPREKKPVVLDIGRSQGPYMRSVDAEPLQFLDSASQIASLTAGVRPGPVQAALDDGRFQSLITSATDVARSPAADAMTAELMRHAGPGLKHVTWTNGGSEAVEKALHLARRYSGGGSRIIAFEGSFHGRTLLSLFSTWNPVKRAPYQLAGFETQFTPFPTAPAGYDRACPKGWRAAWADKAGAREFAGADDIQISEVESLLAVEEQLKSGEALAVLIEPYQCEGGDRAASFRFFHALRALTRAYGVALIFDEVQAGFGLSGQFFWHESFWLTDANGHPDGPDLVVCAKRAQVGLVLSRWPDAYPTDSHSASLLRGSIHAAMYQATEGLTRHALAGLHDMASRLPTGLVTDIRATGDAFAFALPSKAIANKLIAQRFYRGQMVYIAGERTLRYRMNRSMTQVDITQLLASIETSATALIEWAGGLGDDLNVRLEGVDVPKWVGGDVGESPRTPPADVSIRQVVPDEFDSLLDAVVALEKASYESARQDRIAYLRTIAEAEQGIFLVAEDEQGLLGMAFGGPLELWWGVDGPRQDPNLRRDNTLYSADLSIAKRARGKGTGLALRARFLQVAMAARDDAGRPRYAFITGRNRVGEAAAMWRLNQRFGAYEVAVYHGQYGSAAGQARYYRIPLRRTDRRMFLQEAPTPRLTDLGSGV